MSSISALREKLPNADRVWHLRRSGLTEGLSLVDVQAILSVCKDRIYPKKEIIFDQGDPADSLYILNRGCVRISLIDSDGREKILDIYSAGILGENVLTPKQFFEIRATAHEESWVSILSRDDFVALIQHRTSVGLNYGKILCERLLKAREDIVSLSFLDIEHRLGKILLKLAETHGTPIPGKENIVKLKVRLSHEHLAQLVGANRPHVSMVMSRFKKNGWISYQGRKLLINRRRVKGQMLSLD